MSKVFEKCVHRLLLDVCDKEDNVLETKKLCYGLTMCHDLDFPCIDPETCSHYKEEATNEI